MGQKKNFMLPDSDTQYLKGATVIWLDWKLGKDKYVCSAN